MLVGVVRFGADSLQAVKMSAMQNEWAADAGVSQRWGELSRCQWSTKDILG